MAKSKPVALSELLNLSGQPKPTSFDRRKASKYAKAMPRPAQLPTREPLTEAEISAASYAGSKEHKAKRWWGGYPGAKFGKDGKPKRPKKQKTTICWLLTDVDRIRATEWVRHALKAGQCRFYEGDKRYPKHIWYEDGDGQFWWGFLLNSGQGTYKGWPIDESEKIETFG